MGRNLAKTYDPKSFEDRIYAMWEEHGTTKYHRAPTYGSCS